MNALWAEVEQKLTPALVGNEKVVVTTTWPEEVHHDEAFLHVLSTTHGNVKLETTRFTLPAFWICTDGGTYTGKLESLANISNEFYLNKVYGIQNITLTKSGDHFVVVVEQSIYILSFRGNVVRNCRCNSHVCFVAVDTMGLIWTSTVGDNKLLCFTEDFQLVHAIELKFYPTAIACCPDGRIAVASRYNVHFFTPTMLDEPVPLLFISHHHDLSNIRDMKVCNRTAEIYVLASCSVLVFLPDGKHIRSFDVNQNEWPTSIALAPDGHVMVANFNWCRISVWTHEGRFVCEWRLDFNPSEVIFLPHDQVAVCAIRSIEIFVPQKKIMYFFFQKKI